MQKGEAENAKYDNDKSNRVLWTIELVAIVWAKNYEMETK